MCPPPPLTLLRRTHTGFLQKHFVMKISCKADTPCACVVCFCVCVAQCFREFVTQIFGACLWLEKERVAAKARGGGSGGWLMMKKEEAGGALQVFPFDFSGWNVLS